METTGHHEDTAKPERKRISGTDFLKIIQGLVETCGDLEHEIVPIENWLVESDVIWLGKGKDGWNLIFKNCVFSGRVKVEGAEFFDGLSFVDCQFRASLKIAKCQLKGQNDRTDHTTASLVILNSQMNMLEVSENTSVSHGIFIGSNTIINRFAIIDTVTSKERSYGLSLYEAQITESFDLSGLHTWGGVKMDSVHVGAQGRWENIRGDSLSVTGNSVFDRDFHICNSSFNDVSLHDCTWREDLQFNAVSIVDSLTIWQSNFERGFAVCNEDHGYVPPVHAEIRKVWLRSTRFDAGFEMLGSVSRPLKFGEIDITCSGDLRGNLSFINTAGNSISISGVNMGCSLVFEHSVFNQLNFNHLHNRGYIAFSNCRTAVQGESAFWSISSNLGTTEFQNFPFTAFDTINIIDSQWSNIITSGVKWFAQNQLNTPQSNVSQSVQPHDPVDLSRRKREIYRQLKHACQRQADRVHELEFKAREMKSYAIEVWSEGKMKKSDYWVMLAGVTNDFGLNWIRPVCITFWVTVAFYPLLVIAASPELSWCPNFSVESWETTYEQMKAYSHIFFQLFNPARVTERMLPLMPKEQPLHGSVYLLETLHRIILAFLIYQTISAFRKYVK
jgi:hypothetical protein